MDEGVPTFNRIKTQVVSPGKESECWRRCIGDRPQGTSTNLEDRSNRRSVPGTGRVSQSGRCTDWRTGDAAPDP